MIAVGTAILSVKLALLVMVAHLDRPWLFVAVQSLHGLGYSLLQNGAVNLMATRAHRNLRATYQTLYHFAWNLALALGGFYAAFIIARFNSTVLMVVNSAVLVGGIFFFILFVKDPRESAVGASL
jgi:predicted MFS family arabinose efflux permease